MTAPVPNFHSKKTVKVGRTSVLLQDVPVGREFALDGRLYQASVSPGSFARVTPGQSFRYGDKWYRRNGDNTGSEQFPNMPFGEPDATRKLIFNGVEKVSMLEIVCRGDVP